jgi:hypothetical protein
VTEVWKTMSIVKSYSIKDFKKKKNIHRVLKERRAKYLKGLTNF